MGLVSLLLLVIPLVIIILVIATFKSKSEMEGDGFVRSLYAYLVLFATLMMVIGGSIGVFTSVADIISPAPYHQSFADYIKWGNDGEKFVGKSEAELRASYEAMIANEIEREKQRAVNTLLKSFGWIVIPLPVFLFFQRRVVKRE